MVIFNLFYLGFYFLFFSHVVINFMRSLKIKVRDAPSNEKLAGYPFGKRIWENFYWTFPAKLTDSKLSQVLRLEVVLRFADSYAFRRLNYFLKMWGHLMCTILDGYILDHRSFKYNILNYFKRDMMLCNVVLCHNSSSQSKTFIQD